MAGILLAGIGTATITTAAVTTTTTATATATTPNITAASAVTARHHRFLRRGLQADGGSNPCFSIPLEWSSERGQVRVNGRPFHIKGTNWFGFETNTFFPHGLWGATTMDRVFSLLRDEGFNALRVPFSAELALDPGRVVRVADPALDNLGNLARIARFVDVAAQYNILIMMDMHRLEANGGITELWYDDRYPTPRVIEAWTNAMGALVGKWNFFAIDIKNEPHGRATWGAGNPSTDWNRAAEDISRQLFDRFPDWHGLTFIEGVANPSVWSRGRDPNPTWWGGSLEGVWDNPINLGNEAYNRRVVYSPHAYGPDVYNQGYFNAGNFRRNLPSIWQNHFGFAERVHGRRAVVIGEWGGRAGSGPTGWRDRVWHDALVDWMLANCLEDNLYWTVNPNSGDTGGLLQDDWVTPVQPKLDLLARLQPTPSLLYWTTNSRICLTEGAYANPACHDPVA